MKIITGAAGFIGSCMVNKLNNKGFADIVVVDDFSRPDKMKNLEGKSFLHQVHRDELFDWMANHHSQISAVYHLGARTDTAEMDTEIFMKLNLNYSKKIFSLCTQYSIPIIYASSAATYGDGKHGYDDNHSVVNLLKPLNPYGVSKNDFDKWVLTQNQTPPFWAGMKFFNVFGPNEYHKGRMASVVFHAYQQIKESGSVILFRSHNPEFKDGEQLRDFIYVKDVVSVLFHFMTLKPVSGLYNLGSGAARSFKDLVNATYAAVNLRPDIRFIDTPADIRNNYQYYTKANMDKLFGAGYSKAFYSLEEAIKDYVQTYLENNSYY